MVLESPNDPKVQAEVDRSTLAMRASVRPLEFRTKEQVGGHYRVALTTGLTTVLNAADAILSCRWTDPNFAMVLYRLRVAANLTTAFGTAQENSVDFIRMGGFSASDTGGTAATLAAQNKKGTQMANSRVADLRVATTTALGAGTGAADANASAKVLLNLQNALANSAEGDLIVPPQAGEYPHIFRVNEGFRARIGVTQGATGVVRFAFTLEWAEVPLDVLGL